MRYLRYLLTKIGFANEGIRIFFLRERNGQIQLAIAVLVIAFGINFDIAAIEWCAVLLSIAIVLGFEMINTAIGIFCDHVRPEKHREIKKVKDIAAAAVWWSTVIALMVGALIFYPYVTK